MTIFLIWNMFVMFLYGYDKMQSKKHARRISEGMLIMLSFLLGGCGAMLGMVLFNHKTSKMKFRLLIPISFVIGAVALCWLKVNIF